MNSTARRGVVALLGARRDVGSRDLDHEPAPRAVTTLIPRRVAEVCWLASSSAICA